MTYKSRKRKAYGIGTPLPELYPLAIRAQRDPTTADFHEISTVWINETSNDVWMITSVSGGSANWEPIGMDTGGAASITKYVVDADGSADYITIQAAINAANAAGVDADVYVRPGTYTENLTLYDGINVIGTSTTNCVIAGQHTPPTSGVIEIKNLTLEGSTDIFNSAAAGTTNITLKNCITSCLNGYVYNLLNWTGILSFLNTTTLGLEEGIINNTGGATLISYNSSLGYGSTNPSVCSGGLVNIIGSNITNPVTFGGAATFTISMGSSINATLTTAGTAAGSVFETSFSTGATAAISHGSAGVLMLSNCSITSSNNPAIDGAGAGAITLSGLEFTDESNLAATLTLDYSPETRSAKLLCGDSTYRVDEFTGDFNVIQAYAEDVTASGASSFNAMNADMSVTAGDGNHTPDASRASINADAGSNVLAIYGSHGISVQNDGSVVASTMAGSVGEITIHETDVADLPQLYAFGVKGYYATDDAAAVPTSGEFAGVGSVVEYTTPLDSYGYGFVATRLGAGAGVAARAAFGVAQGTNAAADWDYGLDLFNTATNAGQPYTNADIRFQNESIASIASEGVNFSGDVEARNINVTNTRIDSFNVCPILQSRATTGVAPTGATGDRNIMYCQDGVTMEQFIIGAGQTIIAPRLDDTGLLIGLDVANSEGAEYNFGIQTTSKHVYTIGTSADFFFEAEFTVATVAGAEPLVLGFRKVEANNGTWTAYADYATIGIVTSQNAGTITISDEQGGGGTNYTNTTDAWTDGQKHTLRVNVTTGGVVTYLIDGVAPSATAAYTFTDTLNVMPFIHWVQAAGATSALHIHSLKCGYQAWN